MKKKIIKLIRKTKVMVPTIIGVAFGMWAYEKHQESKHKETITEVVAILVLLYYIAIVFGVVSLAVILSKTL